ncbi:MFS transporter [uncultured Lactobacillus sp.]|uniref:MFS transporter n=1 Tax=uncultured Lactobacillus sp. TaxID=153152 RepID=UPI0028052C81|nr:MFS transporter [uncultured Lactobacillus sp.]
MDIKLKKRLVLIIALMSYLLAGLDGSLVLTSLAKIRADLGIGQVSLSWIQNAYGLAYGSLILLSGRLGDMYGRRKIMIFSLSTFALGSLLSGISDVALITIVARFLQGVGAAFLTPTTLALLIDYFSGPELTKALAWYSSIAGIGMSVGLILGGTLAAFWTWRIGFYLNAVLAIALIFLSRFTLEKQNHVADGQHLDVLGALLSILGSGLLVYGLNGAKEIVPFIVAAVVIWIVFVFSEKKASDPVMPLHLLMNKVRINAYLSRAFLVAAAMGFSFFASEYMQNQLHYSPLMSGIGYLPLTMSLFFTAMIVARLVDNFGNEKVLIAGSIMIMLGFGWIVIVGAHGYLKTMLASEILIGIGQGLALAPQTNLSIYEVEPDESGVASSILNMFHQLGGVLGIALMVKVGGSIFHTQNNITQFMGAMIVGLVLTVGAVIVSIIINKELSKKD